MQKLDYPYRIKPDRNQLVAKYRIFDKKRYALFWEMGTGKTKAIIDFVAGMVHNVNPDFRVVVVCPLTVIATWEEQIEENAPFLTYSIMSSEEPRCAWDVNIILTSYDFLRPRKRKLKVTPTGRISRRKKKVLDKTKVKSLIGWLPHMIVSDESHKIKNRQSRQAKAMWELADGAEYRVLLTGTPIGNKPLDLWSQFKLLSKTILGEDYDEFRDTYAVRGGFGGFRVLGYKNLSRLANILSPHVMRRKAEGMPEQNFISVPIDMPKEAKRIYKQLEEEFITQVEGRELQAPIVLARMAKLSQLTGGFVIHPEDKARIHVHSAKLDALSELLQEMQENEIPRVVIFCRYRWEIEKIHEVCKSNGWPSLEISGRVSRTYRKEAERKFKDEGGAIICQIAVGSVGINLQSANYTIFYSVDYSFINFVQAIKRTHRKGQTRPCFYYLLRCRGTIDTTIYGILRDKKEVSDEVLGLIKEIRVRAT